MRGHKLRVELFQDPQAQVVLACTIRTAPSGSPMHNTLLTTNVGKVMPR
jgi:hypothetical protein